MPTLEWMGKNKVVAYHRQVPYRILERIPEKSVLDSHGSDCGNMIIHGDSLPDSLYEAEEGNMNNLERDMADMLANTESILWWHRVTESRRGEFSINGFINHYPDFLAMTKQGTILAVETKGEMLKNDDSRYKLQLGNIWANAAGDKYRYFMVFAHDPLDASGAYSIGEFRQILEQIR